MPLKIAILIVWITVAQAAKARAELCTNWSGTDTVMAAGFVSMATIDVILTDRLLRSEGQEINPVYGEHPTRERLVGTALFSVGAGLAASCIAESQWRAWIFGVLTGIRLLAVHNNAKEAGALTVAIGLHFGF